MKPLGKDRFVAENAPRDDTGSGIAIKVQQSTTFLAADTQDNLQAWIIINP